MSPRTERGGAPPATGVVLAGGHSRRFRGPEKTLVAIDGEPMVRRVVEAVRAGTGRPPIVATHTAERRDEVAAVLGPDTTYVLDDPGLEGPLAGLVGALGAVSTPWAVAVGGDMPLVSPAAIRWLLGRAAGAADAVAVSDDGTPQPLPAAYRVGAVERVRPDLPRAAGLSALLDRLDVLGIDVDDAPDRVRLGESLLDVDTREDLERLTGRLVDRRDR